MRTTRATITRRSLARATLFAASLALPGCSTVTTGEQTPSSPVNQIVPARLALVHTGGAQASFAPQDDRLGLAAVAGYARSLADEGYDVLLLDSGDTLGGADDLSDAEDAVALLNAAGYDAVALGATELALGARTLARRASQSDFALLSANATMAAEAASSVLPNTTATLSDGRLVGLFGICAPTEATGRLPVAGSAARDDEALVACAQQQVAELRKAGCRLVVCLTNLGTSDLTLTADQLAGAVSGIDVVLDVSALSAGRIAQTDASGEETLVVTTPAGLRGVSTLLWEMGTLSATSSDEATSTPADEQVEALVNQTAQERRTWLDTVVATSRDTRSHKVARRREAVLGDLTADACLWEGRHAGVRAKPDAALVDAGSLWAPLRAGTVTRADALAICPHATTRLYALQVSGAQLAEALQAALAQGASADFPQVAGMELTWRTTREGKLRVDVARVGGKDFSARERYLVVATERVASATGAYAALATDDLTDLGASAGTALADYLARACHGSLPAAYDKPQGRLVASDAATDTDKGAS